MTMMLMTNPSSNRVRRSFDFLHVKNTVATSGGFRGGRAGSAPPPSGDRLTQSLTVILANAKY